jgi:hypothetical protein
MNELNAELHIRAINAGIYGNWKTLIESSFENFTCGSRRLLELDGLVNKQSKDERLIKHVGVTYRTINNQRLRMEKTVVKKIVALYESNNARWKELMAEKTLRRTKENK